MEYQEIKKQVLVTGGTGFVGIHAILQLLQKNYRVKTTLRSMKRKGEVIEMLKNGGITSFDNIQFYETDLTKDDNWNEAVKDCDYVLHIASPILLNLPKDENEIIRPAVDGTLRVLKAARDAGVKRVVMTSNFGAVGYSHKNPHTEITEEDWTDPNETGLSSYNKSKALAERAAWNFIQREGNGLELSVINPVAIYGPSLSRNLSSGFELLLNLLNGTMSVIPNLKMNIVDVRDVADLHIRAMTNPQASGQRFLALAGGEITMPQIATFLRSRMPEITQKMSTKTIPDWLVFMMAFFSRKMKNLASMLRANRNTSNAKARKVLNWTPMASNEEAIIAAVESMVKFGNIKSSK